MVKLIYKIVRLSGKARYFDPCKSTAFNEQQGCSAQRGANAVIQKSISQHHLGGGDNVAGDKVTY